MNRLARDCMKDSEENQKSPVYWRVECRVLCRRQDEMKMFLSSIHFKISCGLVRKTER